MSNDFKDAGRTVSQVYHAIANKFSPIYVWWKRNASRLRLNRAEKLRAQSKAYQCFQRVPGDLHDNV